MFKTYIADTSEAKEALYRFRYDVFTVEQQKYRNIANHDRRVLIDAADEHAVHMCLEQDGNIIGSMRSLYGHDHLPQGWWANFSLDRFEHFPSSHFSFSGRLLILPAYRGTRGLLI